MSESADPSASPTSMVDDDQNSATYKAIGVSLAVASGLFIGASFVLKKKGLVESIDRKGGIPGDSYRYLASFMWWGGMVLMMIGEICNFVAYAFTQAILVTPLGALSVVICAILSSIFLKERLSFQGKVGCFQCIVGAIVIVLHAPAQSADDTSIETFKSLVLSVGFLVYACLSVLIAIALILFAVPRWGRTNMLVYISVCSLIGAISVVFTQGLGMAIVHSITIQNQFTHYFIYIVLVLVLATLVVEIVYLNKALNIFNTAVVTPTYYVMFTTLTIVSSIVLYRGFGDATSPEDIATCVLGFFSICTGVALLHRDQHQHPHQHQGDIEKAQQQVRDDDVEGVGPAQLVPFAGITRYASRRRVNRVSTLDAQQQRARTVGGACASPGIVSEPLVSPTKTIAVGNTKQGEDGYTREMRWKDRWQQQQQQDDAAQKALAERESRRREQEENWRHQQMEAAAKQVAITIQEPVVATIPPALPQRPQPPPPSGKAKRMLRAIPTFHQAPKRAQDQLDRLTAYQIGLWNPASGPRRESDRAHLVSPTVD